MEAFSIIAGTASIVSLVISIVAIKKVINLEYRIQDRSQSSPKQELEARDVTDSSVQQIGRDYHDQSSNKK